MQKSIEFHLPHYKFHNCHHTSGVIMYELSFYLLGVKVDGTHCPGQFCGFCQRKQWLLSHIGSRSSGENLALEVKDCQTQHWPEKIWQRDRFVTFNYYVYEISNLLLSGWRTTEPRIKMPRVVPSTITIITFHKEIHPNYITQVLSKLG